MYILVNRLLTILEDVSLTTRREVWFLHDGAPPHFSNDVNKSFNINILESLHRL